MPRAKPDPAHAAHVLLDTIDGDILAFAAVADPADVTDHGLQVTYDGTGMAPSLRLITRDGEVELHGEAEITRVTRALKLGRRMAKAFGPPIPAPDWIERQGGRDAPPA